MRQVALALVLALAGGSASYAGEVETIVVEDAWARATLGSASATTAYLSLTNTGETPERLIEVTSPSARTIQLHATLAEDAVLRMRPLDAVELPPGGGAAFCPGGLHLMLMGLDEPLRVGDSLSLTLVFEGDHRREIEVPLRERAPEEGACAAE